MALYKNNKGEWILLKGHMAFRINGLCKVCKANQTTPLGRRVSKKALCDECEDLLTSIKAVGDIHI